MENTLQQKIFFIYSTFPTPEEAVSVARNLLEKKLIACVNLYSGVQSLYRWEGQVQVETETVMIAKTSEVALSHAMHVIKTLHPYDNPCVVAYPIAAGLPDFLQWVIDQTVSHDIM